jgi:hypothetical protein
MTPDEEIRAARDADRILNDPVFKTAFERIESGLFAKMRAVPMHDIDTQHELILTLQLLGALKGQFETAMQSGKMAQIQKDTLSQKVRKIVNF